MRRAAGTLVILQSGTPTASTEASVRLGSCCPWSRAGFLRVARKSACCLRKRPRPAAYLDAVALDYQAWRVMSLQESGGVAAHVTPRANRFRRSTPTISPQWRWIGRIRPTTSCFAREDSSSAGPAYAFLVDRPDYQRNPHETYTPRHIVCGAHPCCNDPHTIEYAAGSDYVTHDLGSGIRRTHPCAGFSVRANAPATPTASTNVCIITMDGDLIFERGTPLGVRWTDHMRRRLQCRSHRSRHRLERKDLDPRTEDVDDHTSNQAYAGATSRPGLAKRPELWGEPHRRSGQPPRERAAASDCRIDIRRLMLGP